MQVEHHPFRRGLKSTCDMNCGGASVNGNIRDGAFVRGEILSDGVVDIDDLLSWRSLRNELQLRSLDFPRTDYVGTIGFDLGVDVVVHRDSLTRVDETGGHRIELAKLQRGLKRRRSRVLVRDWPGFAGQRYRGTTRQLGRELKWKGFEKGE